MEQDPTGRIFSNFMESVYGNVGHSLALRRFILTRNIFFRSEMEIECVRICNDEEARKLSQEISRVISLDFVVVWPDGIHQQSEFGCEGKECGEDCER